MINEKSNMLLVTRREKIRFLIDYTIKQIVLLNRLVSKSINYYTSQLSLLTSQILNRLVNSFSLVNKANFLVTSLVNKANLGVLYGHKGGV